MSNMNNQAGATVYSCLFFRQSKLAEPRKTSPEANSHLQSCPACQLFTKQLLQHEHDFAAALHVPVPEGLANRIIQRQQRGKATRLRNVALAASVVAALAIGMQIGDLHQRQDQSTLATNTTASLNVATDPDQLSHELMEHVSHEPEAFSVQKKPQADKLLVAFNSIGGKVMNNITNAVYLRPCPVGHAPGWHMVFATEHGQVTVFLMPHMNTGTEMRHVKDTMIKYVASKAGSYAMLANNQDALLEVSRQLEQTIAWAA